MADIYLFNSLTRKKEKFEPIDPQKIGVYSCGPTVYWNQHIGHMYAYVQWDILVRFLRFVGYQVKWVMNITDVGHMTSDEDTGEDKMEKGAKREGLSVWDVANKYIGQFTESMDLLNIQKPDILCRATEHIQEQINLIKKIEANGFTYKTKIGLVYDTLKFPEYSQFAGLKLTEMKSTGRQEVDPDKKSPWDFFLWVYGNPNHVMQWDSPWGKGFPGWHIECTAMSTKYLGDNFDIHTGGMDHIPVHHTNEIAQGYGAFGKTTANYWLHNGMLGGSSGEKMSKSLGNFVTAQDIVAKGYDPLALRYMILNSQYRTGMEFSWEALQGASNSLENLKTQVINIKSSNRATLSPEKEVKIEKFREDFINALSDDLNTPRALAGLWEMLKSNIPSEDKYDLAMTFDEVLGLNLSKVQAPTKIKLPAEVSVLINRREELRKAGKFEEADKVRREIEAKGYQVDDKPEGPSVVPLKGVKI